MATEAKQLVIEKLHSSLEQLREDIEIHRKARLLGQLVEDFASRLQGLMNQGGMDVVSETLEGMTQEIEKEIEYLSSIPSAHFLRSTLLPRFLSAWWEPPSSHSMQLIDEAYLLLMDTAERRTRRAEIYRLAFYSQLPVKSYGLHRHCKGTPLPPKRFADMIHCRHKKLEEIAKIAVMTHEMVIMMEADTEDKPCTKAMENALEVLQYALKVNEDYPEADDRLAYKIEFGENPIRMFDFEVFAHCSDRVAGRKYDDINCRPLLVGANQWWAEIDGVHMEYKFAVNDRGGRRFYDETNREKEEVQVLRRCTWEEINAWNSDARVCSEFGSNMAAIGDGGDSPLCIEGKILNSEALSNRVKSILNITVLSGCIALPSTSGDARGGFSIVQQVDVSRSPEIKSILSPESEIKQVAVKIATHDESLSPEVQYLRFVRELRTWSRLKHENIVPLLGVWIGLTPESESAVPAFISPWMSQGPITSLLTPDSRIPTSQRFKYLHDIASALEYMHYHDFRLAHGDVRGDNVLVDNDRAYLCDFGLSKMYDGVEGFEKGLRSNWRWLPPEMFDIEVDGKHPDPTTEGDMFAFGCLIVEVLSGGLPYLGMEDLKGISKRSEDRTFFPYRPPSIPDGAHWFFCLNCWKQAPTIRPTAREAMQKMDEFMQRAGVREHADHAFIQQDVWNFTT